MPTTPPAILWPALPVLSEYSWPPLPRSSSFDLITMLLPMIEWGPMSFTSLSSMFTLATPDSSASMLPAK